MQIKVNGVTISVENSPVISGNLALDNLEKQSMMLSRESEDITKMIRLYDIMSDVKAVESFGYRSTEGVGEKIANAAKEIWKRIKEFFERIFTWFKNVFLKIKNKFTDIFLKHRVENALEVIKATNLYDWKALQGIGNKIKIDKFLWSDITHNDFQTFNSAKNFINRTRHMLTTSALDYKHFNKENTDETKDQRLDNFSDDVEDILDDFESIYNKLKSRIDNEEYIEIEVFDFFKNATKLNTFLSDSRKTKEDIDAIEKIMKDTLNMIEIDINHYLYGHDEFSASKSNENLDSKTRSDYIHKLLSNFQILLSRKVIIIRYLNKLYDDTFRYIDILNTIEQRLIKKTS